MKYYLLQFNEDYADEHDVPALNCFTQGEYDKWLVKSFAEKNENYDPAATARYEQNKRDWEAFVKAAEGKSQEWQRDNAPKYVPFPYQQEHNSTLYAKLGNSGDNFGEKFDHLLTGQDFVNAGKVIVTEVSENFFTTFSETKLYRLSLCDIFDDISENY